MHVTPEGKCNLFGEKKLHSSGPILECGSGSPSKTASVPKFPGVFCKGMVGFLLAHETSDVNDGLI